MIECFFHKRENKEKDTGISSFLDSVYCSLDYLAIFNKHC